MAKNYNRGRSANRTGQNNDSKQKDLYNTGMPGDNPFQTMYQATMCNRQEAQPRAQTAAVGRRNMSHTPAPKSAKGMDIFGGSPSKSQYNMTAKREQSRKFGAYHGEDGMDPGYNTQSIWQGNPCKYHKYHF